MHVYKTADASIRIDPNNPNHHLYNNNGVWWVHYTIYPDNFSSKRVRKSLETSDLKIARKRRDLILETIFPAKDRNTTTVYFYPSPTQELKIETLARDYASVAPELLVEIYNTIARKGLGECPKVWSKLCSIGIAFERRFRRSPINRADGLLSANSLIDIHESGSDLLLFPYRCK